MKKACLIVAIALVIVGLVIFGIAFVLAGYDISKLGAGKTETNTYSVEEPFLNINIKTAEADVMFTPSDDGTCRVVCVESEKRKHSVTVSDGTLTINAEDKRNWTDHLSFFSKPLSITVYLPSATYDSLKLDVRTGDVSIPDAFSFGVAEVETSTGDIDFRASAIGKIKLKTSTGDIVVEKSEAAALDLCVSTGKITAKEIACAGDVSVQVSTGKVKLTDLSCKNFVSEGRTGSVYLKNVVAVMSLKIKRSTGDVTFEGCDAAEIDVETSTGDVSGSFLTGKVFSARTSSGKVSLPSNALTADRCEITTTTGDVRITIVEG